MTLVEFLTEDLSFNLVRSHNCKLSAVSDASVKSLLDKDKNATALISFENLNSYFGCRIVDIIISTLSFGNPDSDVLSITEYMNNLYIEVFSQLDERGSLLGRVRCADNLLMLINIVEVNKVIRGEVALLVTDELEEIEDKFMQWSENYIILMNSKSTTEAKKLH